MEHRDASPIVYLGQVIKGNPFLDCTHLPALVRQPQSEWGGTCLQTLAWKWENVMTVSDGRPQPGGRDMPQSVLSGFSNAAGWGQDHLTRQPLARQWVGVTCGCAYLCYQGTGRIQNGVCQCLCFQRESQLSPALRADV